MSQVLEKSFGLIVIPGKIVRFCYSAGENRWLNARRTSPGVITTSISRVACFGGRHICESSTMRTFDEIVSVSLFRILSGIEGNARLRTYWGDLLEEKCQTSIYISRNRENSRAWYLSYFNIRLWTLFTYLSFFYNTVAFIVASINIYDCKFHARILLSGSNFKVELLLRVINSTNKLHQLNRYRSLVPRTLEYFS